MKARWSNRIIGEGEERPDQLLANPANWRIHPKPQQDALTAVLDNVGWVQRVIFNKRTGHIVDGHLRVEMALKRNEPGVPVLYVDLSEDEERTILATIDPLSAMAATDAEQLADLLAAVETEDAAVRALLEQIGNGVTEPGVDDWAAAFGALPDGDKSPFQQMTFTLSDRQAEDVRAALGKAKKDGGDDAGDNENSNGNALWRIADAYLHG